MNDAQFSNSIYKQIPEFSEALTKARHSPITEHDRGGGRRQPSNSIPSNYSSPRMSAEAERIDALLHTDVTKLRADDIEILDNIVKALGDYRGAATNFSKGAENPAYRDAGWKPILAADDDSGHSALPRAGENMMAATAQINSADLHHSITARKYGHLASVRKTAGHIRSALEHCEKGDANSAFHACTDAIGSHGEAHNAYSATDNSVARTGMHLANAHGFLEKAMGEDIGMAPGPDTGSMGVAVPGGNDKVSKLDVSCYGVPNAFRKALERTRRMSLAHDAGARRPY